MPGHSWISQSFAFMSIKYFKKKTEPLPVCLDSVGRIPKEAGEERDSLVGCELSQLIPLQ